MNGLKHLKDIYNIQGKEFIDKLFNEYVVISEKLNATRFAFQYKNSSFCFFKKGNFPINKIDRTVMIFYESAINYIESINTEMLSSVPENYVFGFEYFVNKKPINIAYDRLPKNNLVLTDIQIKDKSGQTKKIIKDNKILMDWSVKLDVEGPPIIFKGFLNDSQKEKLNEYLKTPLDSLIQKYKTNSFVKFLISTLNPKLKSSTLNEDLDKPIEGVIFEFFTKNNEVYSAKIVDPIFSQMVREKEDTPRQSNDMYNLVLLDIIEFIRLNGSFNKYKLKEKEEDLRYIELISLAYNDFIKKNITKYLNIDLNSVEFSKMPEFNLNNKFVTNENTLSLLTKNSSNKEIFKIFLNSFRKKRKKGKNNIIDEYLLRELNSIVEKVSKIITEIPEKNEPKEFPTFKDFYEDKYRIKNIYEDEEVDDFISPLETEKIVIISVLKEPNFIQELKNDIIEESVGSTLNNNREDKSLLLINNDETKMNEIEKK